MSVYEKDTLYSFIQAVDSLPDQRKIYLTVDGPVDDKILAAIRERKIDFEVNAKNGGLAKALNMSIKKALADTTIKYLIRMDSDDISHPERISKQIQFMEKNSSIDICGTFYYEMDANGKMMRAKEFPVTHEEMVRALSRGSPLCHASVCFKKDIFRTIGCYSENKDHNLVEDIELWFRAAKAGASFANLSEYLYFVRVTDDFYKRRSFKKSWAEFKVYLNGVRDLDFSMNEWIYPFMRFALRLGPVSFSKIAYRFYRRSLPSNAINRLLNVENVRDL